MPDEPKAMKSELLDSFIEDCMRSTNGLTHKEIVSCSSIYQITKKIYILLSVFL